jgi:hypothetical protein
MEKNTPMLVKVIDGWSLSSRPITHEMKALDITIDFHTNKVIFNVISSPKKFVIIKLSWFALHNPRMYWHTKSLHFETPQHEALECETLIRSMQNLQQKKDLGGTRKPRYPKPLFVGAKAFMKDTKTGNAFFIYVLPSPDVEPHPHEIPSQYQEFKNVFEKKNVNSLPKHRAYNCTTDLEEGAQPPFEPIYNLSQDKLATLHEYIEENFKRGFIQHSKSQVSVPIFFIKKKDDSLRMCVDYCGLNQLTIKNQYPLPLISRLLDQLNHGKVYTKIDLREAYNLVHI